MTQADDILLRWQNNISREIRETFGWSHTLSRLLQDHGTQTWTAGRVENLMHKID